MNKNKLYQLLQEKSQTTATLQFYDMADRYILTIGAYHFDVSDHDAEQLIAELYLDPFTTMTTKNNHPAFRIQTKKAQ